MLELITVTHDGHMLKNKHVKTLQIERYDRQEDERTVTCIKKDGNRASKRIALVGLGKDDYYKDGKYIDIPLKEANAFIREIDKLIPKARESYGNPHTLITYYF